MLIIQLNQGQVKQTMKSELLLVALLTGLTLLGLRQSEPQDSLFQNWMRLHQKDYDSSDVERYRRSLFAANLLKIEAHNRNTSKTYALGLTVFADLTQEEFASQYLSSFKPNSISQFSVTAQQLESLNSKLTKIKHSGSDIDWVAEGYTTPVKNQGQCGSCWAFSATGALEAVSKAYDKKLQSFSQQQLIDCSTTYGNNGCDGGWMELAFQYVKDNGITTQQAYPYTARDGNCMIEGGSFKISKVFNVQGCNSLNLAINITTVSVAVDATDWSLYSSGVFNNCDKDLNHGVLLVGVKNGAWWIKNSWGTRWGEQGFIRLAAGDTCGVCEYISFAV